MSNTAPITFNPDRRDFTTTMNKRVNAYFKDRQLGRHANTEMVIKSMVMLALYFGPLAFILTGVITGVFTTLALVVVMGFGLAGIGLSVMHDGNHGAYSSKRWINTLIGYSLNLIGANSFNWKIQHNVLHHTHTNIYGVDEDVSSHGILRFTPHSEWRWFHKYQFVYAWFLYGLMTLSWMFYKDFHQLYLYHHQGLIKGRTNPKREWVILISTKIIYLSYILLLPILLTPWSWWQVLLGIVIMHYITGFLLAIVFQPAHVIMGSEFPTPDNQGSPRDIRAIHQLRTTTNFANKSRWFTWMVGGLNFQIEHHLYPSICHVHYRKIAPIVQATAHDFNLPYKTVPSFLRALKGHTQLLKQLGKRTKLTSQT
ncbi:fatty acid desaturase family protein [Marinoscillum pacificum]|uniref:fatty acid desaturase family protein n=1 Tax=Marinoscillum pacificum TaxID=392723 RepID=UPI002156F98C|nr:acyl-CoA desaturase [Marinoscillum pacificum]